MRVRCLVEKWLKKLVRHFAAFHYTLGPVSSRAKTYPSEQNPQQRESGRAAGEEMGHDKTALVQCAAPAAR